MKKLLFIFIGLFMIFISGCESSNDLKLTFSTPPTFTPGKPYVMQFKVNDKVGNPVEGAKVSVNLNMKNMDHGTILVNVEDIGDGRYIGTADLPMSGDWVADISVEHNNEKLEDEKQFSVEVKTAQNAHKVTKEITMPDFNLMDQNGNPVNKKDILGKTVVLTFTYINCMDPNACPVLLSNYSSLQQNLKRTESKTDKLLLLSISLDPENDTPQLLTEHAKKMNFDLDYLKMLTGEKSEIQHLADTLGEHFEKDGMEVAHDNKTFIFNKDGKLTHEFTSSQINQDELFLIATDKK